MNTVVTSVTDIWYGNRSCSGSLRVSVVAVVAVCLDVVRWYNVAFLLMSRRSVTEPTPHDNDDDDGANSGDEIVTSPPFVITPPPIADVKSSRIADGRKRISNTCIRAPATDSQS